MNILKRTMNSSVTGKIGRVSILSCLLLLGLSSSARAQSSWWDSFESFARSSYDVNVRPALTPRHTPVLYPHPQTGQPTRQPYAVYPHPRTGRPVPWQPQPNRYQHLGISGSIRG